MSANQREAGGKVVEAFALFFGLNGGIYGKQYCNQYEVQHAKKVNSDDVFLVFHFLLPKRLILTSLKLFVMWQSPHRLPNNLS